MVFFHPVRNLSCHRQTLVGNKQFLKKRASNWVHLPVYSSSMLKLTSLSPSSSASVECRRNKSWKDGDLSSLSMNLVMVSRSFPTPLISILTLSLSTFGVRLTRLLLGVVSFLSCVRSPDHEKERPLIMLLMKSASFCNNSFSSMEMASSATFFFAFKDISSISLILPLYLAISALREEYQ